MKGYPNLFSKSYKQTNSETLPRGFNYSNVIKDIFEGKGLDYIITVWMIYLPQNLISSHLYNMNRISLETWPDIAEHPSLQYCRLVKQDTSISKYLQCQLVKNYSKLSA